jgi:AraC-like DNA-binding protein
MDPLDQVIKQLNQCYAVTKSPVILQPGSDNYLLAGLETIRPGDHYYWDGLKRKGDPAHPFLVFQYTLAGYGVYTEGGAAQKVLPKMAFSAIIPSEHVYYLPPESTGWTFFYLMLNHPYVVSRVSQQKKALGALITIEPDQILLVQAFKIFESVCTRTFRDRFAQEQALFNFLIEYERLVYRLSQGNNLRESVLEEVRLYVVNNLDKPLGVQEIAATRGMSRSHFSHFFKEATGLAPAQFIQSIRLEEAAHSLLETDQKIVTIAANSGFANTTHFCKVFKQHFHLSPGEFRRQLH